MAKTTGRAVTARGTPLPERFYWNKRWHLVKEVLEYWQDTGCWWQGEKEKSFIRVLTADDAVMELYREQDRWFIYKVYD